MAPSPERKFEHVLFLVSVWLKGLAGLFETLAGVLVLFVTQSALASFVIVVTAPELAEDPSDWFASYLGRAVRDFSDQTRTFLSAYLIIHGAIKLILVTGLLRDRFWAYPVSLWLIATFIAYQLYRFSHTHSVWLVLLTVLDIVVGVLIWREFQWQKTRRSHGTA